MNNSHGGINTQSNFQNKSQYQNGIAKHVCQKFSQNEISNDIFEIFQYPILKSSQN